MKLNQVVAIERDIKKAAYASLSKDHALMQKSALVNGETALYTPRDAEGEQLPPAIKLVQIKVEEELSSVVDKLAPLFDLTLTKDCGNREASATLTLGDVTLTDVPVPTLLFLEKQLQDLHTFASKLPVLDPEQTWMRDEVKGMYVTAPIVSVKTAKVQQPLVLYPATAEHPAQTQMVTQDVIAGTWTKTKESGAITEARRRELVSRIADAMRVVKQAREAANLVDVQERKMGAAVLSYLFK